MYIDKEEYYQLTAAIQNAKTEAKLQLGLKDRNLIIKSAGVEDYANFCIEFYIRDTNYILIALGVGNSKGAYIEFSMSKEQK